ncbi:MAG: hypothetical protein U9O94_04220, partial [Nanoarchaeota archaeon]|nr:hypothetical protein [Nanoarchaeota archaeon]
MSKKLDIKDKDRLRNIKRAICNKCKSISHYTNPMARCWQCKKKYCYNHIFGGQLNSTMKENDTIRDVCKSCR